MVKVTEAPKSTDNALEATWNQLKNGCRGLLERGEDGGADRLGTPEKGVMVVGEMRCTMVAGHGTSKWEQHVAEWSGKKRNLNS